MLSRFCVRIQLIRYGYLFCGFQCCAHPQALLIFLVFLIQMVFLQIYYYFFCSRLTYSGYLILIILIFLLPVLFSFAGSSDMSANLVICAGVSIRTLQIGVYCLCLTATRHTHCKSYSGFRMYLVYADRSFYHL